ncbi:zinc finger protein 711-like [Amblyomma americanum]
MACRMMPREEVTTGKVSTEELSKKKRTKQSLRTLCCDKCSLTCRRSFTLRRHRDRQHGLLRQSASVDRAHRAAARRPIPCCDDGCKIPTLYELRLHKKAAHVNGFQCSKCPLVFSRPSRRESHMRIIHEGERVHVCQNCDKGFSNISNLNRHIRAVRCIHRAARSATPQDPYPVRLEAASAQYGCLENKAPGIKLGDLELEEIVSLEGDLIDNEPFGMQPIEIVCIEVERQEDRILGI